MSATLAGWKFPAEIFTANGVLPRDCYVAVADRDDARQAVADSGDLYFLTAADGEPVTLAEWQAEFGDTPVSGEIRYL